MAERVLPTKLFIPPQRPHLVPRPRLTDLLRQGRNGKLTLVAAPAGFGKTTLVTHWLADQRAAWLSLDENDNLFPRFFTYFIAAGQSVYPELAQGLLASLQTSPQPNDEAVLPVLLHELAVLEEPLLMVLDDYHVIDNEAIHEAMGRLIDYMPPTLHLVIISREAPPLPLPRWRVRGQLTEVGAADLRFTVEETAAFLGQTMGVRLDEPAVTALEKRTEGWVAALQLAALSLRGAADDGAAAKLIAEFGGSSRHVADYLVAEVLHRQPPEVQRFLLGTAVLERFCAELCAAVLEGGEREPEVGAEAHESLGARAQQFLDHLESANLFLIPLDAHRRWYRYHHLFAQLLQDRALRELGRARVKQLCRRASQWFADQDLTEEAVHYALQGEDFDEAARLVAAQPAETVWDQGNTSLLIQWGREIPTESLQRYPRSLIAIAAAHLLTADLQGLSSFLALCEGIESIYGEYALLKCTVVRNEGDFRRALHLAQEAGEFLAEEETTMRAVAMMQIANNLLRLAGLKQAERVVIQARQMLQEAGKANLHIHLQVIQMQGAVASLRADHHQAERLYQEGLALAEGMAGRVSPLVGVMYAGLGEVRYEWNELGKAAEAFSQARSWADRTGIFDIVIAALVGELLLLCQRGEVEAAEVHFEALRTISGLGRFEDMSSQIESLVASSYLHLGELEKAVRWAKASGLKLTDRPDSAQRFSYQVLIAVRLAEIRASGNREGLSQVLGLLDHLLRQAEAGHYRQQMIELLILQALAREAAGEQAASQQALARAVELAEPGGLVRTFLDQDPALAPLLAQLEGAYARRLYLAFRRELEERGEGAAGRPFELTPREREVLREIVAGLSNKAIQEKLVISQNTVRTHIKNLYSKLGVTSRTQAIKKARELNLVKL